MRVLSIKMSQITVFFHATRQEGQLYLPNLVEGLVRRYKFADAPRNFGDIEADAVEFRHGLFRGNAVESLRVFSDGIVIKSRSDSDEVDAFIADFTLWTREQIGLSFFC
ncbi:MAG: hypothetical protein OXC17_03640 [Aestuariivita sp.]|nr:hypothetical protein [Aestuariivita sp.]